MARPKSIVKVDFFFFADRLASCFQEVSLLRNVTTHICEK